MALCRNYYYYYCCACLAREFYYLCFLTFVFLLPQSDLCEPNVVTSTKKAKKQKKQLSERLIIIKQRVFRHVSVSVAERVCVLCFCGAALIVNSPQIAVVERPRRYSLSNRYAVVFSSNPNPRRYRSRYVPRSSDQSRVRPTSCGDGEKCENC